MVKSSRNQTNTNNFQKTNTKHKRLLSHKAKALVFCVGLSFVCFLNNSNIVFAKQVREVTGNDELLLEISRRDITRLSIENDKISSLQFSNGILDVTTDVKLGEAYIKPRVENAINLFVSTKKGFVYKLLLQPIDIPSEQIILRNKNTFISEGISKGISNDIERRLTDIILSIQQGVPVENCFISSLNGKKVKSPIRGIKLYAMEKYLCKDFTGYKIDVKKTDNDIHISEKDFITKSTRAVKLYNNYLIIINSENE